MNLKSWITGAAGLAMCLPMAVFANDPNQAPAGTSTRPAHEQAGDDNRAADPAGKGSARHQTYLRLHRASEIIGKSVTNAQGQDLGRIEEVVVDTRTGRIRYAALSFGGLLGIGTKYFALPWDALQLQPKKQTEKLVFNLDIDKQRLENAPGFDKSAWPDVADEKWATDVMVYWKNESERGRKAREAGAEVNFDGATDQNGREAGASASVRTEGDREHATGQEKHQQDATGEHTAKAAPHDPNVKRLRKLNAELMNRDIKDSGFSDLGDIEEIMIDLDRGRIAYLIVEFDDTDRVRDTTRDGKKELYFPIPYQAVSLMKDPKGDNDAYVVNIPVERINREIPRFSEDNWPDMQQLQWNTGVFGYYRVRPYWDSRASGDFQARREPSNAQRDD